MGHNQPLLGPPSRLPSHNKEALGTRLGHGDEVGPWGWANKIIGYNDKQFQ
jgi:hypothetical protein